MLQRFYCIFVPVENPIQFANPHVNYPFLRTFYGTFIRTLCVLVSNEVEEDQMTAALIMLGLRTAGIGFFVRFLVGLCKEEKYVCRCYLIRVQPEVMVDSVAQSERGYDSL